MTKMSHGPACCGVRNARECGGANSRHLTEVRLHLASLHAFFDLVNCRGWMHGHEGVLRVDAQRLGQGRLRAKKALVETRERVFEGGKVESVGAAAHAEWSIMRMLLRACVFCCCFLLLLQRRGIGCGHGVRRAEWRRLRGARLHTHTTPSEAGGRGGAARHVYRQSVMM